MPAGDGTGPSGMGPMTGRAMGYCAGYDRPGFANPGPGFGRGRGFGRGFGWRRGFGRGWRWAGYAPVPAVPVGTVPVKGYPYREYTKQDEIADLKAEKDLMQRDLRAIQEDIKAVEQRIKELESKK